MSVGSVEASPTGRTGVREVVVFARAPRLGQVKTRLAAGIGAQAALDLYRALLEQTVARLRRGDWETILAVTPDEAATDDRLWPEGVRRIGQGEGDLGARMGRPLARAGEGRSVLVVGSDIPGLDRHHGEAAFAALEHETRSRNRESCSSLPVSHRIVRKPVPTFRSDALETADGVVGPAADGGFYLIGAASRPPSTLMDGVRWSSDRTLADLRSNATASGWSLAAIERLDDLDDARDLARHRAAGRL